MTLRPIVRDEEAVPDPCQIVRGTSGDTGEAADCPQGAVDAPPQVSGAPAPGRPKLPKLMSAVGLPLRPGCGAGAPVPAERQAGQVRQGSK